MTRTTILNALRAAAIAGGLLALTACVAGSSESQHAASAGWLSQLLLGVWHGLIAPVTLIVELINRFAPHLLPWSARMYEAKSAGALYDLGFYFGLAGSPVVVLRGWSRPRRGA